MPSAGQQEDGGTDSVSSLAARLLEFIARDPALIARVMLPPPGPDEAAAAPEAPGVLAPA